MREAEWAGWGMPMSKVFFPTVSVSARKDYDDRWRRQAQAQSKAQAGRYKGRAEDVDRDDGNARVIAAIGPGALSKPSPAAAGATISRRDRETRKGSRLKRQPRGKE